MNTAVTLVRAYLHANGYFAVAEYPIVEALSSGKARTATDIDILAVRLPGAALSVARRKEGPGQQSFRPDPELKPSDSRVDLIIGEVKEGYAELNRGARDPAVLRAVLRRFGGVASFHDEEIVADLIERGESICPDGPRVRLMAFGSTVPPRRERDFEAVTLSHCIEFLRKSLVKNWDIAKHARFKDPALGFLVMALKALGELE